MAEQSLADLSSWIIPITVTLIVAIIGPWIIEYWKWRNEPKREILHEKEVRYFNLLTNLKGFIGKADRNKIEEFYEHYRTAWLYVPDDVICLINRFFITTGYQKRELDEADKAACNLVWQMRKDFYGDTKLNPEEFLILKPS